MSTTLFKNVDSQRIRVYAYTPADGNPKTGDAANLTAYIAKDYGSVTALTDTSATEEDATNAPGYYWFDITQPETNADNILVTCKSSTSGVKVLGAPAVIGTRPATGFLAPTTAGRTLDVSATGEAGIDWANIGSPAQAQDLSGTTIKTTQKVDVETIKTQAVTCAAGVTVRAHVGFAAAPGTNTGAPTVDASNRVAGIQGATKHTLDDLNDPSSTTIAAAVWNALTSGMSTVGSIGKKLADWVIGTTQTGDTYALANGASGFVATKAVVDAVKAKTDNLPSDPADESAVEAAIAAAQSAIQTDVAGVQTDVDDIQARLPAALTANGNMKSDVLRINGNANAAARHALNAAEMIPGTVEDTGFAPTTTEVELSDVVNPEADFWNGAIMLVTSGAMVGLRITISDYALVGGRGHFTFPAIPTALSDGDTVLLI